MRLHPWHGWREKAAVGPGGPAKRGGARVIYFYHDADVPLFALTAYAKNERPDLSQADRNEFRVLTGLLVDAYKTRARR